MLRGEGQRYGGAGRRLSGQRCRVRYEGFQGERSMTDMTKDIYDKYFFHSNWVL